MILEVVILDIIAGKNNNFEQAFMKAPLCHFYNPLSVVEHYKIIQNVPN